MKNFRQSKKALSPVVASIILIAVTVAVSIAVAAWMGALVVGQMQTEELKITSMTFTDATHASVVVHNFGTNGVTLTGAWINNAEISSPGYAPDSTVEANTDVTITLTYADVFVSGGNYQVRVSTAQGNVFMYNAVA